MQGQLKFSYGRDIDTVAQHSNFTIFKITLTRKDTFKGPRQYTLRYLLKIRIALFILIIMDLTKLISL